MRLFRVLRLVGFRVQGFRVSGFRVSGVEGLRVPKTVKPCSHETYVHEPGPEITSEKNVTWRIMGLGKFYKGSIGV